MARGHWTAEEERLYREGVRTCGKGNLRKIAKYFVTTRTPSQVASYAQKLEQREKSGKKRRNRNTGINIVEDTSMASSSRHGSFDLNKDPEPES